MHILSPGRQIHPSGSVQHHLYRKYKDCGKRGKAFAHGDVQRLLQRVLETVIGALRDGRRVVLAVMPGQRESIEAWSAILRDLKARGLNCPKPVIADGHLGIWGALTNVFPAAKEQRCWNHPIMNLLDKIPKSQQVQARQLLTRIPYAERREQAARLKREFQAWCRAREWDVAEKGFRKVDAPELLAEVGRSSLRERRACEETKGFRLTLVYTHY